MDNIIIAPYVCFDEAMVEALYRSVGWTSYLRRPGLLKEAYARSLLTLAAHDGTQLVGVIRAVGDGVSIVGLKLVDGDGKELFPDAVGCNGVGDGWAEFLYPYMDPANLPDELWLAPMDGDTADMEYAIRVK